MEEKKENMPLIVAAVILTALVIACIVAVICMNAFSGGKNKDEKLTSTTENKVEEKSKENNGEVSTSSTSNSQVNSVDNSSKKDEKKEEDEDTTPEEVKKINDSEKMIYERVIDGKKIPTINLTTKYATKVNEEVEKKYKDNASGQYIVYSYCMYIETVTLILDNVNGSNHSYNIYNVDTATGKKLTNEKILEKVKMSKDDFNSKVKKAYQAKYEEVYKDQKSSSNYNLTLEKTLKNAESAYEKAMYIDPYGVVCCMATFVSPIDNSECEYEVELK